MRASGLLSLPYFLMPCGYCGAWGGTLDWPFYFRLWPGCWAWLEANDLEQLVAQVWCRVLHLHGVHRSDRFRDLGGDSLLALRACAALRYELGGATALPDEDEVPGEAQYGEQSGPFAVAALLKSRSLEDYCGFLRRQGLTATKKAPGAQETASRGLYDSSWHPFYVSHHKYNHNLSYILSMHACIYVPNVL